MSFKSLLFCPDEKTAQLVTQVLGELDFSVETANESFAAVQRLTEEQFHALVVDCQNEQDAALLFKAARNSAQNGGSLAVAVVEGQAGVAKAFRIGANLVLTKPINVEQSKSTLRVARGLLKKTQAKSATTPVKETPAPVSTKTTESVLPKPAPVVPVPPRAAAPAASSPALSRPAVATLSSQAVPSVPFSGLVVESEPEPVTEAADAAILDSLPEITGKRSTENNAPALLGHAEPIAASTSGQGAAAVMAPDVKSVESRPAGAAPMFTNEPIVATSTAVSDPSESYTAEPVAAPSFSSLENVSGKRAGGMRFVKIAAVIVVIAGGTYFAWQQPAVRQRVQSMLNRTPAAAQPATSDAAPEPTVAVQSPTTQAASQIAPAGTNAQNAVTASPTLSHESAPVVAHEAQHQSKASTPGEIEIQEMPIARGTVAPKAEAIVVKNSPVTAAPKPAQPAAPSLDVVTGAADAKLPNLAPAAIELPRPAPGAIRISQGVSQGLLIKKVAPVYPAMAQQLHREGTVQLLATIDKAGDIKKVQVLSGDGMLARAAVDAVKEWEYRPYLLNGQPVEIETQITVLFKAQH